LREKETELLGRGYWSEITRPVLPLANDTAEMTQHEWKCVFEDRAFLFVSKGIHIDDACHTACGVRTGGIVETCYMRGELLLNPTGVGNSAMLVVHVELSLFRVTLPRRRGISM
jgi:hypothetical protein